MIEVERKFLLNDGDFERLTEDAELISEKSFTDTYYDDPEYRFSSKDIWLRSRDGNFELKLPMEVASNRNHMDQYDEITEEQQIVEKLGLKGTNLTNALAEANIKPFATFLSHRKKYQKDEFILDFDQTDFDYSIGEIELLVKSKEDLPRAIEKIQQFASDNSLTLTAVRGKLIEFIRRNNPQHYNLLLARGVVTDQQDQS